MALVCFRDTGRANADKLAPPSIKTFPASHVPGRACHDTGAVKKIGFLSAEAAGGAVGTLVTPIVVVHAL